MTDVIAKFDRLARGFSEQEYADPDGYYRRRARLVVEHGPRLDPGDSVLDLGCGDGGAAPALAACGLRYRGVDASRGMVDAARERHGAVASFELGELDALAPVEAVDAVTCFRAIYYTLDRPAFFARVRSFTRKKFLFDFSLRDFPRDQVERELRDAGFTDVRLRPFLYPQHHAPPPAVDGLLRLAERGGPLLLPVMKRRFTYVVSAARRAALALAPLLTDMAEYAMTGV